MDFAVHHRDQDNIDPDKRTGQWVLAVDPNMGGRFLLLKDDMGFEWVSMADYRLLKLVHPEVPRPVIPLGGGQQQPSIVVPRNGLHLN